MLWQIEECLLCTQADEPFMSLYRDENDQVVVGCWNGAAYVVNALQKPSSFWFGFCYMVFIE